ncbi:DNA methyltransferase [Gemmobacter lanyuensis]|uniref:DNA methyltransferase n=1 Tax=Gemmobacter lanyuensis TaxID=1054497 RepID=UPI00361D100F
MALVEAVLEAFTDLGDLVFEPFCGSGTQLIAAERTGRRCCAGSGLLRCRRAAVGDGDGAEGLQQIHLAGGQTLP